MHNVTRNLILAVIGLGILVSVLAARKTPSESVRAASGQEIRWLTSLDAALEKSRETGQPIMIDFFATWCPPCKMLDAQTYSDPAVIEASKDWLMVRIDVDKNKDLALQYQIESIPTIVMLEPSGAESSRFSGFVGPGSMLSVMQKPVASSTAPAAPTPPNS